MASRRHSRVLYLAAAVALCICFGSTAVVTPVQPKAGPSTETGDKRITGGSEAVPGAWPWMAGIFVNGVADFFKCGATLISPQWVVTAAHCTVLAVSGLVLAGSQQPGLFKVRLGEQDMDKDEGTEQEYQLKKVLTHPKWTVDAAKTKAGPKLFTSHDIALLKLASPVNITERVKPVAINTGNQFGAGKVCQTAGWGTETLEGPAHRKLHQVALPLVSRSKCNAPQSYSGVIAEDMLCAGYDEGGKDTCLGDSGGPLMCKGDDGTWYLTGVASFGHNGCGVPLKYGIYVGLQQHADWISKTTGLNV